MRSAFISDFGGVLTSPLSEGFLAYQEESKVSLEELGKAMARAAETHGEHPLFALERGEISEREFADRLERELPGGFSLTRLREVYFERLVPNAPMIAFARELRERGLRTALLTNNVREWEPLWRAKLPELDEIFEVVVDSAFVGMRKPDPQIYELTLERLGAVADRVRLPRRSRGQLRGGPRARDGRGAVRGHGPGDRGDRGGAVGA